MFYVIDYEKCLSHCSIAIEKHVITAAIVKGRYLLVLAYNTF